METLSILSECRTMRFCNWAYLTCVWKTEIEGAIDATPEEPATHGLRGSLKSMNDAKKAYFAIAVFELGTVDGTGKLFREDFYLVYADDDATAKARFENLAREEEYTARTGEDKSYVRLAHIIDVAPTLRDMTGDSVELYSRHFASLETYSDFEMKLGGRDPFAS
ncbi:DUF4288 domain-containing protein [Rhodococcus sp. NPDC057135]|uniref:DUF4288 domain-containing protein n=1 Tax=Rhodococcus sp. NPDC057135 TaxID=3346028 RepID=UPI00362C1D7D